MARFNTSGIDHIINEMVRMGEDVGPTAEEMCMAAVEEIRDSWKKAADAHGFRDTGEMIASIGFGATPIRASNIIANDVYPMGKDSKGVRNAEKAFILHYGSSKIPSSYWVDEADEASAEPVQARIEAIWDRFIGK